MVFVGAHFMSIDLIKDPAFTHDRRRFDVSDLNRDANPRNGCSRSRRRNLELIVLDWPHGAAGDGQEGQRCNHQAARSFHLRTPPGLRSSTLTPRTRLAGLLLIVSVKLRMFAEDTRMLSRIS